jgi:molybdopterin-guanine dinucleotide biosynthesis protein A
MEISGIILAGGKSRRLGRDKTKEIIGDNNLLDRVLTRLANFDSEIIIVKARESSLPDSALNYPKLKIVDDIYPGKGSIGGIYTGLLASATFHNIVVACDMPFLNPALLRYMVEISAGFDLVALKEGERFEPLHAVYSKNCLEPFKRLIQQDRLRIIEILTSVKVYYLKPSEIEKFDPGYLSFFNINNEAELKAGRELARKEVCQGP